MRKLASSEKTLFFILCGALFLAFNLFGLRILSGIQAKLQSKINSLSIQLAESHSLLLMAEKIQPAITWVHDHPLPRWSNDQASAQLLKCEREEAEKAGLKIIEENLLPPHDFPYGSSVSVQTKISGSFDGLVKFLFALQTPTAWRAIDKFMIKSDSEPTKVIIDLEIKQFFQATSSP